MTHPRNSPAGDSYGVYTRLLCPDSGHVSTSDGRSGGEREQSTLGLVIKEASCSITCKRLYITYGPTKCSAVEKSLFEKGTFL